MNNPLRKDFPLLTQKLASGPLTYLDSAATTQKPQFVLDAMTHYYTHSNANVHRAAHQLAASATQALEDSREAVRGFINANEAAEILFTAGTTESINLIANCLTGRLNAGDEILISHLEHHSNIVPWQLLAQRTGAQVVACNVQDNGDLDLNDLQAQLDRKKTKVVALGHVSNALGTVHPIAKVVEMAHAAGALCIVDGAQAVGHMPVNVQALGCDAYAFSAHKMYGPTGVGVLYGQRELLDSLPPWQGGGEMILSVSIGESTYNELPHKFEAGTPPIAEIIGLGAAVNYLTTIDRAAAAERERHVLQWTVSQIKQIPGYRIVGEPFMRSGVVSFVHESGHPHDIATLLDQQGIAVRSGHHCAMPLMEHLGITGTIRASFGLYNNTEDAQRLIDGLHKAASFL